MKSQWYMLKPRAIKLRQDGRSIRSIEAKLKIPKSTLSWWFRSVTLTQAQKNKLKIDWTQALVKARKKAVLWHNAQKATRLADAQQEATSTLKKIDLNDRNILDLATAMLYLGEGFKGDSLTGIGNSNPLILKFFIRALIKNYDLKISDFRADLHIRADQDPEKIKQFWSNELHIPKKNFKSVSIDIRTRGSKTYPAYKGVCIVRAGRVRIQRKLLYMSELFCNQVVGNYGRVAQLVRASR